MKNVTPYSLDDEAVRSDAAVSVISSIGLTAVIVWADLLGHGFGFAPSSSIIQQLGNARLFFLVGFTLCAIGSVLLARAPQRKTQVLTKAAPTAAFLGTGLYGFAYLQTALPSEIIALLGLVCCGAGYYATTLLIYCELAKTKRLVMAIGALSASLILKTIVGSELSTALTSSAQVVFASILPWVSFACLEALKRFGTSRYLEAYRSRPLLTKKGMYDLVFLLVAVSLILAALRGTSHLGLWGSNHLGSPVSTPAGYLTVALALTACAYLTLLRNSNNQMLVRYQPAFLVLAGGFLIYVLQNEYVFARIADPVFDWLYLTVELFGHLLSGTMIITAIRSASAPAWLFQGISDSAFGLVAVPWLLLVQEAHVDIRILMAVAIFLVMVAAIRPMSTRPMEIERSLSLSSCEGAAELQGDRSTSASEPTERNEPSIEQRVSETLTKYHLEIAKRHNLSLPRKRGIPPFGSRQKPSLYLRGILLVRWHRQNAYHAYLPQIRCPQSTSFHRPSSERDRGARHAQWTPKRIAPKLKRAAGTDAKRCPRIGSHDKISFGELALGSSRPGLMSCIRPGIQSNPSKIASKIATACHLGTANEDVLRRNYAAALARVDILAPIA